MLPFSSILATIQGRAALLSLLAALAIFALVAFIIATSAVDEDKLEAKHKVYAKQKGYTIVLSLSILAGLGLTLQWLPYPQMRAAAADSLPITVVGSQWAWKLAPGDHVTEKPRAIKGAPEISLPVNKTISFLVTAADVNHNFAIYSDQGVLLAQTQAMPGYYNVLSYAFAEKGDYPVLCLEYCGAPHVTMKAKIHVE